MAVLGAVVILATCAGFGYLMLRSALLPPPTTIVAATAVITLVAVVGYAVKPEAGELAAIAATGVGALAGSVAALFTNRNDPPDDPPL